MQSRRCKAEGGRFELRPFVRVRRPFFELKQLSSNKDWKVKLNSNKDWKDNLAANFKATIMKRFTWVSPRLQALFILRGPAKIYDSATKTSTRLSFTTFRQYSDHYHTTAQILSRINKKQKTCGQILAFYQFHVRARTCSTHKIHA